MVTPMVDKRKNARPRSDGGSLIRNSLIASTIRRSQRNLSNGVLHRKTVERMRAEGRSEREIYDAGIKEGQVGPASNLADVLYNIYRSGLGRAVVVEESNKHVLLKVDKCLCKENPDNMGCSYIAGYLAGALMRTGKYRTLEVRKSNAGTVADGCYFLANLNI